MTYVCWSESGDETLSGDRYENCPAHKLSTGQFVDRIRHCHKYVSLGFETAGSAREIYVYVKYATDKYIYIPNVYTYAPDVPSCLQALWSV